MEMFIIRSNEDRSREFRMRLVWDENFLSFWIFESGKAWFTSVSNEVIDSFAEQHEMDSKDYRDKLEDYLMNGHPDVVFEIIGTEFVIFRVKDKIRLRYFFANLECQSYVKTMEFLLGMLETKRKDMSQKIDVLKLDSMEKLQEMSSWQKKHHQLKENKCYIDDKMKKVFLAELNHKKGKTKHIIRMLKDKVPGSETLSDRRLLLLKLEMGTNITLCSNTTSQPALNNANNAENASTSAIVIEDDHYSISSDSTEQIPARKDEVIVIDDDSN